MYFPSSWFCIKAVSCLSLSLISFTHSLFFFPFSLPFFPPWFSPSSASISLRSSPWLYKENSFLDIHRIRLHRSAYCSVAQAAFFISLNHSTPRYFATLVILRSLPNCYLDRNLVSVVTSFELDWNDINHSVTLSSFPHLWLPSVSNFIHSIFTQNNLPPYILAIIVIQSCQSNCCCCSCESLFW